MSDAPITLAEMVAEAERILADRVAELKIAQQLIECAETMSAFGRLGLFVPPSTCQMERAQRRSSVMEEIARYLRREMEKW